MPYTFRRPTLDDAQALLTLMRACDVATIGRPDTTLADVVDELRDPDLDLDLDAWIAVDPAGVAVACGFVFRRSDADIVDFDVYVHPSAHDLYGELWDLLENRATQIGRELGHSQLRLDVAIYRADERQRVIAAGRGYAIATVYYRMRIDHTAPAPKPQLPPRMRIDTVGSDQTLRQAAYDVETASFAQHFGFVKRSYEWWEAKFATSSSTSWDSTRVLSVDGVPAGMLLASTQYVEDENCGYVDTLGVLAEHRGRGIGRLLLLDAFAQDFALGQVGTILHVDANNVTPALGLYESVGMRQILASDGWRRTVEL